MDRRGADTVQNSSPGPDTGAYRVPQPPNPASPAIIPSPPLKTPTLSSTSEGGTLRAPYPSAARWWQRHPIPPPSCSLDDFINVENYSIAFAYFCIYCCLYIVVTVRKVPLRLRHNFSHFSSFSWNLKIFTRE